jgi:uncharacterized protein (TIGR01777 family)
VKVLVSGSSGLLGRSLVAALKARGDEVLRLVRRKSSDSDTVFFDVDNGVAETAKMKGIDAMVHMAGEPVAEKWTVENKRLIRQSRKEGTELLAQTLAAIDPSPSVFISGSAIGYYGDRGDELLTESALPGTGFLPEVCQQWENATGAARVAGIRTIMLRTGIVLSSEGGALSKMLATFNLGMGGHLGNGRQYMSWVAIDDVVGAILFSLTNENMEGPTNMTAPNPVRNSEFTSILGKVLRRPTFFPVPAGVLRLAVGEMADELILASANAIPKRLAKAGYNFQYPELEPALRHVLNKMQ